MSYKEISISTGRRNELVDITGKVKTLLSEEGVRDGVCTVFIPHTTASVTINENADPDVADDMAGFLEKEISPSSYSFRHSEGNSDAHIKSSLIGSSVTIIIHSGRLLLGTWQGIYFAEFDGPRQRKIWVKFLAG